MSLFNLPITVKRFTGSLVDGVWVETFSQTLAIQGTIQPVEGEELQFLPENRRDVGTVKVYTTADLNVSEQGMNVTSDRVLWDGKLWEIVARKTNSSSIISHNKYFAQLKPGEISG